MICISHRQDWVEAKSVDEMIATGAAQIDTSIFQRACAAAAWMRHGTEPVYIPVGIPLRTATRTASAPTKSFLIVSPVYTHCPHAV